MQQSALQRSACNRRGCSALYKCNVHSNDQLEKLESAVNTMKRDLLQA
jgi:hypothetical protein